MKYEWEDIFLFILFVLPCSDKGHVPQRELGVNFDVTAPASGFFLMHLLSTLAFFSICLSAFVLFLCFCSSALFQGMLLSPACVTLCGVAPSIMRMDSPLLLWLPMKLDMCKFVLHHFHQLQCIIVIYCIYIPPFCLFQDIQRDLHY